MSSFSGKVRQIQLVGQKIRQLRKEHKLTQVELSQRLGIQQSDLSRMEQGEYRVSLDTLFRILAEFKMSIGEFFEDINQETITPRDVRLIEDFNALSADAQREVESFIAFKRTLLLQGQEQGPEPVQSMLDGETVDEEPAGRVDCHDRSLG